MKYLVASTKNIVDAYMVQEKFSKHKSEILFKNYTRVVDKKRSVERVYLTAVQIGDDDAI